MRFVAILLIIIIPLFSCSPTSNSITPLPYFPTQRHTDEPFCNNKNTPFVWYYYVVNEFYPHDKVFESTLDSFVCSKFCIRKDTLRASYIFLKPSYRTSKWYMKKYRAYGLNDCEISDYIRTYSWSVSKNKIYGTKTYYRGGMATFYDSEQFSCKCQDLKQTNSKYWKLDWPSDFKLLPEIK